MAYEDPRVACQPWIADTDLCCAGADPLTDCNGAPLAPNYPWTDAELIEAASDLLYARTCYIYPGLCTRTVWPCLECGCGCHPCGCGTYYVIHLTSDYPIQSVDEVRIDGVVMNPADYRLEEGARLVKTDGDRWPPCNNLGLTAGPTVQGAEVEVDYTFGRTPPQALKMAAAELVCELKKACNADASCSLPPHVKNIERRGVEIELHSVISLLEQGLTGNPIIDHALTVYGKCAQMRSFDPLRRALQVRQQ